MPDVALLMASAVTAADAQPSLAAKIRQQINLFGHQLVGSGIYWQQGRGDQRRFRLELKVPLGDGLTSFEQVSTGHELWVHEDLLDHSALTKIDLDRVRALLSVEVKRAPARGLAKPIKLVIFWLALVLSLIHI